MVLKRQTNQLRLLVLGPYGDAALLLWSSVACGGTKPNMGSAPETEESHPGLKWNSTRKPPEGVSHDMGTINESVAPFIENPFTDTPRRQVHDSTPTL